jgi:hypothetical protein
MSAGTIAWPMLTAHAKSAFRKFLFSALQCFFLFEVRSYCCDADAQSSLPLFSLSTARLAIVGKWWAAEVRNIDQISHVLLVLC